MRGVEEGRGRWWEREAGGRGKGTAKEGEGTQRSRGEGTFVVEEGVGRGMDAVVAP